MFLKLFPKQEILEAGNWLEMSLKMLLEIYSFCSQDKEPYKNQCLQFFWYFQTYPDNGRL